MKTAVQRQQDDAFGRAVLGVTLIGRPSSDTHAEAAAELAARKFGAEFYLDPCEIRLVLVHHGESEPRREYEVLALRPSLGARGLVLR